MVRENAAASAANIAARTNGGLYVNKTSGAMSFRRRDGDDRGGAILPAPWNRDPPDCAGRRCAREANAEWGDPRPPFSRFRTARGVQGGRRPDWTRETKKAAQPGERLNR
jgi:hypothetical protein